MVYSFLLGKNASFTLWFISATLILIGTTISTGKSHRTSAYGSSLDKKIGKWNWYHKWGVIPLETEPGARFTNSGGPLNVNVNHYFRIFHEEHNPGNTKVSISDR